MTELALKVTSGQISKIENVSECIELAGKADALAHYSRKVSADLEQVNRLMRAKILAERQAGKLLLDMSKPSNQHSELPTLADLGVSRMQASRWQSLARVSDERFNEYCESQQEEGKEITSAGVQRLVDRLEDRPLPDRHHLKCPACGCRSNRCIETGEVIARVLPRRRKCLSCNETFRTWEMVIGSTSDQMPNVPLVVKNS